MVKICVIAVCAAFFNLPRFFEHHEMLVAAPSANATNLGDSRLYQVLYSNVAYCVAMYVIPLGSLSWMNTKLIRALRDFRRKRRRMVARDDRDHVTLCVVITVCVFVLCQTPALVNQIFWAALGQSARECGGFHFHYTKISDFLVVFNSACNILVYCMAGKRFRALFKVTFPFYKLVHMTLT
jgi:neuropeptide Y receptor type 1